MSFFFLAVAVHYNFYVLIFLELFSKYSSHHIVSLCCFCYIYLFQGVFQIPMSIIFPVTGDPSGVELVIPDCCEDKLVVPRKTYFGGQEGEGDYIWYRMRNKLNGSELVDISNACEDVDICGKTL